jgi:hypothetical protein
VAKAKSANLALQHVYYIPAAADYLPSILAITGYRADSGLGVAPQFFQSI